jgi:DNA-binding beta-propeller fold protein YncE
LHFVSERRDLGRFALVSVTITLALVALLAFAGRAQAAETIYWDNYDNTADTDTVSFADITGSGGGTLNLGAGRLEGPEGMAYDTVTNRLFVSNEHGTDGEILAVNLDGSGAGVFSAPGALVDEPEGVAVDPVTRTIYWVNTGTNDSIGWAKLDGSTGGLLNTAGATINGPYKIALDPVGGRVYWANSGVNPDLISYANVNGSGGGDLTITGGGVTEVSGLAVDPAAGRIYILDPNNDKVDFAPLGGGAATEVNLTGAAINEAYGLAFDPSLGRLYWGNYGNTEERTGAIGFVNVAGGGGGISPLTAPVNGPQDPVVLKSPTGTGAPTITRNAKNRAALTCSTGSWAADFAGSFVYQAPRTFAYQWTRNGSAVPAATAATFNATAAGQYACTVTAANQTGSATQTSAALNVKAAKVKLSTKKKAKAGAGDLVTFKVKAINQGDVRSKKAKVCVKLPKAAKADLKAPKCKKLAKLNGRAKKTVTIKVKVKPGADEGTDKLTFQIKGTAGKAAKSKIVVG